MAKPSYRTAITRDVVNLSLLVLGLVGRAFGVATVFTVTGTTVLLGGTAMIALYLRTSRRAHPVSMAEVDD